MLADFDTKKVMEYYEQLQEETARRITEGAENAEWLPGKRALLYVAGYMKDQEKAPFLEKLRTMDNEAFASAVYLWSARHLLSIVPGSVYGEFAIAEIIRQEDYKADGRWNESGPVPAAPVIPV